MLAALEQGAGERTAPRLLLPKAIALGEQLAAGLSELGGAGTHVQIAGSARRWADSVKDVDLIAVTNRPTTLAKSLAQARADRERRLGRQGRCARAHALGHQRRSAHRQARAARQPAAALHRLRAPQRGAARGAPCGAACTSPSTGCSTTRSGARARARPRQEVYELLGLAYIEPELREDRGELEAARLDGGAGLPALIELADIRGDLHSHTIASDGHNTIEEMALAARERGYEYLAITDHSATHGFGNDVSPEQLRRQIELVHEANERVDGDRAARRQRGQHPARRLARLRRRAARLSSTG